LACRRLNVCTFALVLTNKKKGRVFFLSVVRNFIYETSKLPAA
jgi:hypothetical protein